MKKILMIQVAIIILFASTITQAGSMKYVGIRDVDGDKALVTATGSLFVHSVGSILGTVTVMATDFDIRDLTAASDTVSIEGGNAVDVSIDDGGNSITVDASDLDIRDLTSASDTVSIEGGNAVDVSIDDGGNSLTVDASNLDIRDLTSASDTVSIEGGNIVDVSIDDGGNAITVDATDLDIRNLTAASDTVTISGSLTPTYWDTTEFVNYGVPATSASGANLDPAASSNKFTVQNNHTVAVWVKTGATPAENDGIKLGAGATWIVENVTVTDLEIYNPDSATAQIAVNYWR